MDKMSTIGAVILEAMLQISSKIIGTGKQSMITENVCFSLEKFPDGSWNFQESGEGYTLYSKVPIRELSNGLYCKDYTSISVLSTGEPFFQHS